MLSPWLSVPRLHFVQVVVFPCKFFLTWILFLFISFSLSKLRLACSEIWNTATGGICVFGICCNSFSKMWLGFELSKIDVIGCEEFFSIMNCQTHICMIELRSYHTAGRDIFNDYLGNYGYDFVKCGNLLCSRLALLLILCYAKGIRWVVEQPEGSSLPHHPRFQYVIGIGKVPWFNCI